MSAGRVFGCLVCPRDPQGYVGFETQRSDVYQRHMRTQHKLTSSALRDTKLVSKLHLNRGERGGETHKRWAKEDGTPVVAILSWFRPDPGEPSYYASVTKAEEQKKRKKRKRKPKAKRTARKRIGTRRAKPTAVR